MTLGDYLADAGRRAVVYGAHDCATLPADWAVSLGWPDPMARWRGAYRDEAGARALIDGAGGLLAMWRLGCGEAGIPTADQPCEGAIGVARVTGEAGPIDNGAIFTGRRWAFLAPRGLFVASIEPEHVLGVWLP